jgi:tetratricopeptide (TPR) repeat protein
MELTALRNNTENLSRDERAHAASDFAKKMEKLGEYETAALALEEFWPDQSEAPIVDGLETATRARVLLRIGNLIGFLGASHEIPGNQERAKDLISQSMDLFESVGNDAAVAESRGDLALCYWREGGYDEARIHLAEALNRLGPVESDLRAVLLIRAGIIEERTRRLQTALNFYQMAEPLVEKSQDEVLKGAFHGECALVFRHLAAPEKRDDYVDRALIEYAAASFHYEQAGSLRSQARIEANLGYLYFKIDRFRDAHRHIDRARSLYTNIKAVDQVYHLDETRARLFLAEGRFTDAERTIRQAIRSLERGDQQSRLTEALTTYGVVLARLGRHARSRELLERAIEVGEIAGDIEGAGRAKICIIEELRNQTSPSDLVSEYKSAVEMLRKSQDPGISARLIQCSSQIIESLTPSEDVETTPEIESWDGFSFKREVLKVEKKFIERALRDAGGSVTRASRLLGFRHHQSLIALINSRHRDLLGTRSAVRKRRHHLFSKPRRTRKSAPPPETGATESEGTGSKPTNPAGEGS